MDNIKVILSKNNWIFNFFLYSFIIISALLIYGYRFPSSNNLIELPPVMALLNPELFKNDYYVQETLQITPRYYYQYIIYFTSAKLGLDLFITYFIYYCLAFASFVLGLYALGRRFGKSQLSGAALVFLGLFNIEGTVGYVSLFRSEPIPAVLAMGLTIWGLYFGFCKRWNLGYLFFGLACIVQFLVGFLPAILMMPLLLLDVIQSRNYIKIISPLLILGAFAGLVYFPMVINGNTGTGLINDQEFVFIYGYLRQPHHILPSHFPIQNWRAFICLMIGGIFCIYSSESLASEDKKNLLVIIVMSFLCLVIGYIFVEIIPLAMVAKLQLARTTPFAQLMVLIVISVLISEHYQQKNWAICILLLVFPLNKNGTILFFLVALGIVILKTTNTFRLTRNRLITAITIIFSVIFLAFYPSPFSVGGTFDRVILKLIIFSIIALPFLLEKFALHSYYIQIKIIIYVLSVLSWLFLSLGLLNILPKHLSQFVQSRISNINSQLTPADQLTRLALRFKENSDNNALILTPPSMTEFRFYSQRSLVYTFFSSPYTDQGFKEWIYRLETILGKVKPSFSIDDIDKMYYNRKPTELVQFAQKFGADYILTRTDRHSNIKGIVVDQEGDWIIYKITKNQ